MVERDINYQETASQPNDACIANSVVSVCSKISGLNIEVPQIYYQWRSMMLSDMARMYDGHQRRLIAHNLPIKERRHYDKALHKLDQKSVMKFIDTARNGQGLTMSTAIVQTILQDCEIEYKKGGLSQIREELKMGRQVVVSYQVEDENKDMVWHVAHVGQENEELISFSDGNIPLTSQNLATIDATSNYLNQELKTWNFVSVRKFGA